MHLNTYQEDNGKLICIECRFIASHDHKAGYKNQNFDHRKNIIAGLDSKRYDVVIN